MGGCETTPPDSPPGPRKPPPPPPTNPPAPGNPPPPREHLNHGNHNPAGFPHLRSCAAACRRQARSSSPLRGCGGSSLTPDPRGGAETSSCEESPAQQPTPAITRSPGQDSTLS